jgi:hypothetical protein
MIGIFVDGINFAGGKWLRMNIEIEIGIWIGGYRLACLQR